MDGSKLEALTKLKMEKKIIKNVTFVKIKVN